MTLVLPPWLPPQLVALAAGHFPEAKEDVMRLLAVAKRATQAGLLELADEQDTVASGTVGAVTGSTGVAAAASITVSAQRLRDLAESLGRLADQLVDGARNMEFEKLLVIYTLIILAVQLTLAAALPGGSVLALARWVTAKKTLQMGILQLLARLRINGAGFMASSPLLATIVQGGGSGVVQGAGADLLAQWTQIGLNTREEIDGKSVWVSAASGGAGGIAGDAAARRAAPMVGRLTASMSEGARPKVEALALGGIGGAVGAPAGLIASVLAAGGDPRDLTAEDWRSGLVSGVGGGVIGAAGYALRRPPNIDVPAMLAPQSGGGPGLVEQRAWAPRTDTGQVAPDRVDLTRAADPAPAAPSFSAPAAAESFASPRPQAGEESTHPSQHPAVVPPQPETFVPAQRQPLDDTALFGETPGRTAMDGPADSWPRPDAAVSSEDRSPTNPIVPQARSERDVQTETTPEQNSPREVGAHQPSKAWTADSLPEQLVGPEAGSETLRSGRPSLPSAASEISAARTSEPAPTEFSTASAPAATGATSSDSTRSDPSAPQPLTTQPAAVDSSPRARQNSFAKDHTAKFVSRGDGRRPDDARGADNSTRPADTRSKAPAPQVSAPQHHMRRPTAPDTRPPAVTAADHARAPRGTDRHTDPARPEGHSAPSPAAAESAARRDDTSVSSHATESMLTGQNEAVLAGRASDSSIAPRDQYSELEDVRHLEVVQEALRDSDGQTLLHADPSINSYGGKINDGGITVPGRVVNCVQTSIDAVLSFNAFPSVSGPRSDDDPSNSLRGEKDGVRRIQEWTGQRFRPPAYSGGPAAKQFESVRRQVQEMGPGSCALVEVQWKSPASGTEAAQYGAHMMNVVYPQGASEPVWWDAQSGETWRSLPTKWVTATDDLTFIALTPEQGRALADARAEAAHSTPRSTPEIRGDRVDEVQLKERERTDGRAAFALAAGPPPDRGSSESSLPPQRPGTATDNAQRAGLGGSPGIESAGSATQLDTTPLEVTRTDPNSPVLDPAAERSRELWRNVTEAQGVPVVDHTAVFKTEHDDAVHTMRGTGHRFPDADRSDDPAHVDAGTEDGATLRVVASAPHHDLNELLSRYAYADGDGWNGGDSTYIRKLPGGRHVVMFSDTFLGDVNPDGSRSTDTSFISNSFVVIENDGSMRTVLGSTDDSRVQAALPPVDGQFHWLGGSHVTDRDTLDVMFLRFSDGTQIPSGEDDLDAARFRAAKEPAGDGGWAVELQENVLARFDAGDLQLLDVTPMPSHTGVHWASWVEFDSAENRTYIYGVKESGLEKFMHVARVQGDDLRQPWEFFDGAGRWSKRESDSASIMPGVANEYSVTRLNDGLYLLVTQDASVPFSPDILGYLSKSPTGPFGSPTLLYRTSESGPTGFYGDANMIMYNAHEQPDLRRGNQLTITYNLNSSMEGVLNDSAKYRPTAVKVTIDLSTSMRYDSDDLFAPRSADPAGHIRNRDPSAGPETISSTDRDHSAAQGESFATAAIDDRGQAGMRTPWSPRRPADQGESADAPGHDDAGP